MKQMRYLGCIGFLGRSTGTLGRENVNVGGKTGDWLRIKSYKKKQLEGTQNRGILKLR